ncbi:MAG TPA: DUF6049 family protein [Streptosporangiaceae bacterium]
MHGLLRAKFTRRIGSLAAAVVLPALVSAALFGPVGPAQADPVREAAAGGGVSVAIDSMNPQVAKPGAMVSVAGTVTNGTNQTIAGLDVQLSTSPTRFQTRDAMDAYLSQDQGANLEAAGNPFFITTSLRPGATAAWHASFQVDSASITEFGVYPVTAQLGGQQGGVLATDQTLLPFWPGQQAAGLLRPLDISWIWPLIDQPHDQACGALTNNDLAASLGPQGRLYALLAAGRAHPDADLTWVIDPALLGDAATMTRPYQVESGSGCAGQTLEPASRGATAWLSALRAVTSSGRPTVITPYANVDASALVHSVLDADLASAYAIGTQVADGVLHGSFRPSIAVPAGGTADLSLLTNLAAAERIDTVVLDSTEMPPRNSADFEDDAATSIPVGGTAMTVLLADHVLTGVLQAGNTSTGVLPPSTQFAVGQRFLAETAMIAAEAPDTDRSIVVRPPDGWSPSPALASQLLTETARAPWLTPTSLGDLARAPDTARSIKRQPPSSKPSPAELSPDYLNTISQVGNDLSAYQAMLYQPSKGYQQSLEEVLAATESSAWRGSGMSRGLALADGLSAYLSDEESKVKIIAADQVSMGGASGAVPVSIQNGMSRAIRVKVNVSVVNSPDRTSQLSVGHFKDVIVVQPQLSPLVRLPVNSAPQGSTVIQVSLTTADGAALLPVVATKSLTVLSTRYGRAILFLIAAAIGVMILTSVYRGVRRWLRAESHVAGEDAGQPGSVGTGTSARHPMEAPDDLAEARRRADDP